ncbi:3'(2'),5'-bisphosphate nucleotidase CysQ [Rhizobium sp. CFBP 8762]|uniref:3'(2'),5'-bisphosphate nucleotidase CysQ n=1 Tax=Rhizobium sp. CFBP 8762 TaxID=2775279 RepID=UPI00178375D6|nr:3'(2'),5'-bisphosphate nucleotidase CysQ [Rhizobium sp. CFBP 8762]MBD8553337.1 3'(2'),5'-bisphosphate nucleotidase CysQ [Rhizobium sp. CFBP 8762]
MTLTAPQTSYSLSEDLTLITAAARAAGDKAMEFFGKKPEVWWKNGDKSPVSAADFASNDILKEMLLAARPDYGWLSEETDDDKVRLTHETVFVVDPIDGTRAFIEGLDVWCVCVAVVHRGRPISAALYAPVLGQLYQATSDSVALLNGKPIHVHPPRETGLLQFASAADMITGLEDGYRAGVHRIGHVPSLAYRLVMIADGRIDGTIVKTNSHDWDLAAADLILQQAGGSLTALDGKPLTYNRSTVRHSVLCAAPERGIAALVAAAQALENH